MNTWKWKVNNVTDLALAISDHYNWNASSIVMDEKTKRRASVQAAFCDTATDFHKMVRYGKFAIEWFSQNWPGIPYPFEKMTIIQGYPDMEYPMMVNNESFKDTIFSKLVVEHEIAHTYMPFYLGTNETQYGFMDEGWTTVLELLVGRADFGIEKAEKMFASIYGLLARKTSDSLGPLLFIQYLCRSKLELVLEQLVFLK